MNDNPFLEYSIIGERLAELVQGADALDRLAGELRAYREGCGPNGERIAAWDAILESLELRAAERHEHLADVAARAELRRQAAAAERTIFTDTADGDVEPLPACYLVEPRSFETCVPQARAFVTVPCPVSDILVCFEITYGGDWNPFRYQTDGGACSDSFCEGPVQPRDAGACCGSCATAITWARTVCKTANLSGAPSHTVGDILRTLARSIEPDHAYILDRPTILTEIAR